MRTNKCVAADRKSVAEEDRRWKKKSVAGGGSDAGGGGGNWCLLQQTNHLEINSYAFPPEPAEISCRNLMHHCEWEICKYVDCCRRHRHQGAVDRKVNLYCLKSRVHFFKHIFILRWFRRLYLFVPQKLKHTSKISAYVFENRNTRIYMSKNVLEPESLAVNYAQITYCQIYPKMAKKLYLLQVLHTLNKSIKCTRSCNKFESRD